MTCAVFLYIACTVDNNNDQIDDYNNVDDNFDMQKEKDLNNIM